MSAFICGPDHFKVLAIFAASRRHGSLNVDPRYINKPLKATHESATTDLASIYADILYQENIRSVRGRYPDDKWDGLPGPIVKPLHIVIDPRDQTLAKYRLSPVAILKMCDCLEYQSCENEDYRQTVAFALLDSIRGAAIRHLTGYEDAPWDYYTEETKAA
jgi:hypothetical protein